MRKKTKRKKENLENMVLKKLWQVKKNARMCEKY